MRSKLTYMCLCAMVIIFASCSSAYKLGQTPDDVYYSPAPPDQDGYVVTNSDEDQNGYYNNSNVEDLSIRRGISDPIYRSSISLGYGDFGYMPYDYYSSPFLNSYGFYNPYNSFYPYNYFYPYTAGISFYPYNSPNYFGGFYSPYSYYSPYYSKTISAGNYGITPRRYNLGAYQPSTNTRTTSTSNSTNAPVRTFNQKPPTSGVGGLVRRIFTPSDNGNSNINNGSVNRSQNNDFSSPTRSTGGNSGGGNSGGGGGSVRTFRH